MIWADVAADDMLQIRAGDLEQLVIGYHQVDGDRDGFGTSCVCGWQFGKATLESHQAHMVREAMRGVVQL